MRPWCSVSSLCDRRLLLSLSLPLSVSLSVMYVCCQCKCNKVSKSVFASILSHSLFVWAICQRVSPSLSLPLSLFLSLPLYVSFFILLSFPPSLCLSHTLVVQLLPLEFSSECSTRSAAAAAQLVERKTLDTNLNCSDACKLLQARAVSPPLSPPHLSPPSLPMNVVITSLPATVRANMQIARKIQFMNANAIHYSRSVFECV